MTQQARRVLLLTPNYRPESNAGAHRLTSLAEYLADVGQEVVVVTLQPHHPQNRIYDGYDVRSPHIADVNGVRVVRIKPWLAPKDSLVLRLLAESLFCLQTLPYLLREPTDVILASSPYMFLGPVGLVAGVLRRRPFVWDVRDLTWLYPAAAGKRTFGLDRVLASIMRLVAARASALTTATEGLFGYFQHKPREAAYIPNGVNDDWLDRLLALPAPARDASPVVAYAGLFGYNHGAATIIEAAALLPEASFVLVGDGPEREALVILVTKLGLRNVTFTGYLDQDRLIDVYRRSSVLVSHVRSNPIFLWTQPAKVWEYMAAGRPVVLAGEGEVVGIVDESDIAVSVPPERPEALAAAIGRLIEDHRFASDLGERARAFVIEHRRRSRLNLLFAELLERVVRGRA